MANGGQLPNRILHMRLITAIVACYVSGDAPSALKRCLPLLSRESPLDVILWSTEQFLEHQSLERPEPRFLDSVVEQP
jgi:hypothetical protein